VGRQELEIILGEAHISFTTTKLGSLMQVQQSKDPDGLRIFYYLVQVGPPLISFIFRYHPLHDLFLSNVAACSLPAAHALQHHVWSHLRCRTEGVWSDGMLLSRLACVWRRT
jgi:hypothetical protein